MRRENENGREGMRRQKWMEDAGVFCRKEGEQRRGVGHPQARRQRRGAVSRP